MVMLIINVLVVETTQDLYICELSLLRGGTSTDSMLDCSPAITLLILQLIVILKCDGFGLEILSQHY